ncbi:MAG: hypothetical protein ACM369_00335 [Acidobacteriota bacterium]
MLMALALLAAIEAVPSSTVSLTLTGETDRPPVSATPRTLSDVARELKSGRKAVGGFSAVESTVPQSRNVYVLPFEPEPEYTEPEPEVVVETQPVYVPTYLPTWFGGRQKAGHHHHRIGAHLGAPRVMSPPLLRPSAQPPLRLRHTPGVILRQR